MGKFYNRFVLIFVILGIAIGQDYDPVCSKERISNAFYKRIKVTSENQHNFDVKFYDLFLDINPTGNFLSGKNKIAGIVSGSDSLDQLDFDLAHPLIVDSVKNGSEILNFTHTDNLLKIFPIQALAPGEGFDLTVYYQGTPYTSTSGWSSFSFDVYNGHPMVWTLSEPYGARTWWPCKDTPLDKADSMHIDIKLPITETDTLVAVSNGLLVNTNYSNSSVTYSWVTKYPMATYLASIAVYPYIHWREWYYFNESDSMPLDYYVFENWEQDARSSYAITYDMMTTFNKIFGAYPFKSEKYGHYMFLFGGGMEHQTITGLGTMNESVIAHELAHQWYGDQVTCEDFGHIWLNEGFARYSQALWEEFQYGLNARNEFMKNIEYFGPGTIFVPENSSVSRIFSSGLTYNKAGWVVHMLRYVMGDTIFFEVLKDFTSDQEFEYKTANTEKLRDYCERRSVLNLDKFFEQWIYGEHYPDYSYNWSQVEDTLKYRIDQGTTIFEMPVDLGIILGGDTLIQRIEVNDSSISGFILLEPGARVDEVLIDPQNWILNQATRVHELKVFPHIPDIFSVGFPYPNPFNSSMRIIFRTSSETTARIAIFDLKGKEIYRDEMTCIEGKNEFLWNGKAGNGTGLPTGLYLIMIAVDGIDQVRKVLYLK